MTLRISYDIGVGDECIVQSDGCVVVMVVFLFVVCYEGTCRFVWCFFKSIGGELHL